MTIPPTTTTSPRIIRTSRISPQQSVDSEHAVPLSLLDATTATFGLTSAVWLIERPTIPLSSSDLPTHLRKALSTILNVYPQWCGYLKAILSKDGTCLPSETASFPPHARRYGRVYVHFGTDTDPGVEFIEAKSTATVDDLYTANSGKRRPVWNRLEDGVTLTHFTPATDIVLALKPANNTDADGSHKPIMAVQYTELACGAIVLAAKIAHPLADITSLTHFVRDWANVSRAILTDAPLTIRTPIFEPCQLDSCAAGDIDAARPDPSILKDALDLPLHRYDWWDPPAQPPSPFPADLPLAGTPLPWSEWDTAAPVEQYTIHFNRKQIDHLWQSAVQQNFSAPTNLVISKHDALLAHIWSCVVRARGLEDDPNPVHCDLVLGVRPAFRLDDSFLGSPTMMLNIEMDASDVASGKSLGLVAHRIRETISTVNTRQRIAAHLHSIAYEKSPQRIWQAFLGRRHCLVTTWARAGIYDVDFGLGGRVRYADGMVPCLDGCILIVDGPPSEESGVGGMSRGWTKDGVDVTLPLKREDMQRLLRDPVLLPKV